MKTPTKTIVIWDQVLEHPIQFFVVPGDHRELHNVYINRYGTSKELLNKLDDLIGFDSAGKPAVEMLDRFPVEELDDSTAVIVAGFIP